MSRLLPISIVGLAVLASAFSGCRSVDPYCQAAIANLRAEKIQLENEFYALKSMYESDMAREGKTPSYVGSYSTPVNPTVMGGEVIYGTEYYPDAGIQYAPSWNGQIIDQPAAQPILQAPVLQQPQPAVQPTVPSLDQPSSGSGTRTPSLSNQSVSDPAARLSRFIREIEIDQLAAERNEATRLLIRPLDKDGAILPIPGDVRLRLYNPTQGTTVFEQQFSAAQVKGWVIDQPGQQPGIHVSVPRSAVGGSLDSGVICDLQFLTADNRLLKQSTELLFADTVASNAGRRSISRPASRPASQPISRPTNRNTFSNSSARSQATLQPPRRSQQPALLPDSIDGALEIEIGQELNFDSLPQEPVARPRWSPDR